LELTVTPRGANGRRLLDRDADERHVPEESLVIEPPPHHKGTGRNGEPDDVGLDDTRLPGDVLLQQTNHPHSRSSLELEVFHREPQGTARLDDVFHQDDVLPLDRAREVVRDARVVFGGAQVPIRRDADETDLVGNRQGLADGDGDIDSAIQHTYDDRRNFPRRRGEFARHLLDALPHILFGDQHLERSSVVDNDRAPIQSDRPSLISRSIH